MYGVVNSERVRKLCEEKGMTRRDLAIAAGISVSTVRRAERQAPVQGKTVWKVARVFGLEASQIARPARRKRTKVPYLRLVK